ncbi:MAG: GMC family oxidoreductase [Alphaproteobacteria bacterium]
MSSETPASFGKFDFVIVGAGSAGCVLANRLTADPKVRVLLLEAGTKDTYPWIHIPVGYFKTMHNPKTDWCFKTEPVAGLGGRSIAYPRGKTLGGCSSINGHIYMRGQARDYDGWRQMGNEGWGWDDVLPYFKRSEDQVRGADEFHGAGGPLAVTEQRIRLPVLDLFVAAAEQAGIPRTQDFNRGDNEGCGYFQVTQKNGFRWSAARAFLNPVKKRPNLTLLTHAHAAKIVFDGRRAAALEFWRDGKLQRADVARELLLTAGAVGSPHLLQASGVGPADILREKGVAVVHDLPGVGENLQDHLQLRLIYKLSGIGTLNERVNSLFGRAMIGAEYVLKRTGPMTMGASQLGCFAKSDPSRDTANVEYHIQPLSTDKLGDPLHPFPALTASVCNLRPTSRGQIRLTGADTRAPPSIQPNYLSTEDDRRVAVDSIKLTRRIVLESKAFAPHKPEEFLPGASVASDAEMAEAAGKIGSTIFHPVGTCKMGGDSMAVVDAQLRVHGLAGLRVVDASIMPTITSGNTNAPVYMIAEKAADFIRAGK